MKEMTDMELEQLIGASFERQELMQDISRNVMTDIRKKSRQAWLRKWGRVAAFSFGVPTVLGAFGVGISETLALTESQPFVLAGLVLSTISMLVFTVKEVKDFSINCV